MTWTDAAGATRLGRVADYVFRREVGDDPLRAALTEGQDGQLSEEFTDMIVRRQG
jgi:hypothetical protein